MPLEFSGERTSHYGHRFVFCFLAVFLFFLLVFARLAYLQIVRGNFFRIFSAEQSMKEIRISASRGVVYDRNHVAIAQNRLSFDLIVIPQHVGDIEKVKKTLQKVAGIDPGLVDEKWGKESKRAPSYFPLVIAADIPYEKAVKIRAAKALDFDETEGIDLSAIDVIVRPLRSYPQGVIASTTLGYVGEISEKDLAKVQKD